MPENDERPAWHGPIERAADALLARLDSPDHVERRQRILAALEVALSDVRNDALRPTPEFLPAVIFRDAFLEAISEYDDECMPGMWTDPAIATEIRSVVGHRIARARDMPAAVVGVFDRFFPGVLDNNP